MGGEITQQSHLVALEMPRQCQVLTPSETYWTRKAGGGALPPSLCIASSAGPGDESAHSRQRGPGVECDPRDRAQSRGEEQQSDHRGECFAFTLKNRQSPGGPILRTPSFHCKGHRFHPRSWDSTHGVLHGQKKTNQTKSRVYFGLWKVVTQKRQWNFFGWYLDCFEKWKVEARNKWHRSETRIFSRSFHSRPSSFFDSLKVKAPQDSRLAVTPASVEIWYWLLEKEMATHSSILAWKIPWKEEPGRL